MVQCGECDVVSNMSRNQFEIHQNRFTAGMVDEFRVIFDIIDSNGSGELDLLGVKRACGLLGQKRLLDRRSNTVPVTADSPGDAKNVFQ